ncbi:phosphotransferase [Microbulbifer guangxiensis]|uniref:phosphotransferase n=1 Tax=Microbulbifer guangxiensis TaxID=2904249 RepID=UPI001F3BA3C3
MSIPVVDVIPSDWGRWAHTRPELVRQLSGGLTNENYLITAGDELYVLRRNSAISAALDLDREAEADALHRADRAGLSAPLVYWDPNHRYLVTRYLKGRPWRVSGQASLRPLADLLRRIHSLAPINACLDVEEKIARYSQSIDTALDLRAELQALQAKIQCHIDSAQSLSGVSVLCHNDLVPANLIACGPDRLYALDWEYAAMGDPFYDLAVIAEEHSLEERHLHWLLSAYLGREPLQDDWLRLHHWRVIYVYLAGLWYTVQCSSGVVQAERASAVIRRLKQLLRAAGF